MSAVDLLKALEVTSTFPYDHPSLSSVAELEQVVAFSMMHCAGIERTFMDQSVFENIVHIASTIPHSVSERV